MGGSKGGDCLVSNTLEGSSSAAARNLEMTAFVFSTLLREFQTNIFREAAQAPATGKAPVAPATGSGADFPTWIAERDDVVVRASSDLTSPKVEVRCRTKPRRSQRCGPARNSSCSSSNTSTFSSKHSSNSGGRQSSTFLVSFSIQVSVISFQ